MRPLHSELDHKESAAIIVDKISKFYGDNPILKDVCLHVDRGEIVSLLGKNGTGKTTLIRIIVGEKSVTHGKTLINDLDPRIPSSREGLGYVPQALALPDMLTVSELIDFVASHFKNPRSKSKTLEALGIVELADRKPNTLSGGQNRLVMVALSYIGGGNVLVLDEPTVGMDIEFRKRVWDLLKDFRNEGGSVLLTTHYIEEADYLSDRVLILSNGELIFNGTPHELKRFNGVYKIYLKKSVLLDYFEEIFFDRATNRHYGRSSKIDEILNDLVKSDKDIEEIEIHRTSLEEAIENFK